jgi:hypothetical protein
MMILSRNVLKATSDRHFSLTIGQKGEKVSDPSYPSMLSFTMRPMTMTMIMMMVVVVYLALAESSPLSITHPTIQYHPFILLHCLPFVVVSMVHMDKLTENTTNSVGEIKGVILQSVRLDGPFLS